jgi:hypothetical protein
MTMRFLRNNAGKFVDLDGNVKEGPAPDESVVIVAGFWPDMPKGAMQEKCKLCKRLVGVDKNSQAMLAQPGKVHTILCRDCWQGYNCYRNKDVDGLLAWLDRMEKELYD